jgi:hypothetical protein
MSEFKIIEISSKLTTKQRFERFNELYIPHGKAGLSEFVDDGYTNDSHFISLSNRLFSSRDKKTRISAIKFEYEDRNVICRRTGKTINVNGVIGEPFLSFFKAWINVHLHYSGVNSRPRAVAVALRAIEMELRVAYGNNAPWNINYDIAHKSVDAIQKKYSPRMAYEIAQYVEVIISMLNDGHKGRRVNYYKKGFNLFSEPFSYKNPINDKRSKRVGRDSSSVDIKSLSDEDIYSIVRAYRIAKSEYGVKHYLTYYSGLCVLPVICSLRISEIFSMSVNSLFQDPKDGKWKLRVYRYKNNYVDDVPVPDVLVDLTKDVFDSIIEYTKDARSDINNYVKNNLKENGISLFKNIRNEIDNLEYIPLKIVIRMLGREGCDERLFFHHYISKSSIDIAYGVDAPNDIGGRFREHYYLASSVYGRLNEKGIYCEDINIKYISVNNIMEITKLGRTKISVVIKGLDVYLARCFVSKYDLNNKIIIQTSTHIKNNFVHYPYADKYKYLRIEDALCVAYQKSASDTYYSVNYFPELTSPAQLNSMISSGGHGHEKSNRRNLFEILDIKKRDGSYPDFTIHSTRKYHQTSALLRGASVIICDRLAGRQTGYQSDYYDLRTTDQILKMSIDFFDPTADYDVIGSDAEFIPNDPISRKKFLEDNVSPKHTHEYGGCNSDWSLNPCEQFGGCLSCGRHEWMKGDELKFEYIVDVYKSKIKELARADHLIEMGNDSVPILKHRRQIVDDLNRCKEIIDIESDDNIKVGTIVTFSKAAAAFTTADHVNFLRSYTAGGGFIDAL